MKSTTTDINDFHKACRDNDIPRIKAYLARMTIDEINQWGPNKSTALHTAAYNRDLAVVYLLLRHGAQASITNSSGLTPFAETTSSCVKRLLSSSGISVWIEWTLINPPSREMKQLFDLKLENTFRTMGLPFILDYLLNHYARQLVAKELPAIMHNIEPYFARARTSISLFPLIELYTARFKFDRTMNSHCVTVLPNLLRINRNPENPLTASIFHLIAAFYFDPMLRPKYIFTGCVYRGVKMSTDYIRTYRLNELVVNRAFLSTSKKRDVADIFGGIGHSRAFRQTQSSSDFLQAAVRLTYYIRRLETRAIDITNLSEFGKNDEEVLLMPISVFRVIDIKTEANGSDVYITLEDCDLPSENDPLAPIIRCDFAEVPDIRLVAPIVQSVNNPVTYTASPFSIRSADWRRQLAAAIVNMSTKTVIIFLVAIIIFIILVLLAVFLPISLRPPCNNALEFSSFSTPTI